MDQINYPVESDKDLHTNTLLSFTGTGSTSCKIIPNFTNCHGGIEANELTIKEVGNTK